MINLFLMKHILKYLASGHQLETCVLLEFRAFNSKTQIQAAHTKRCPLDATILNTTGY